MPGWHMYYHPKNHILMNQIGQPDSLVEYQHYMRINGYVWSATPVEGEVGQRLQFQQPFNVLLI